VLVVTLKTLHVLAATVFFGTGLGTAWVKVMADRTGDVRVIAWAHRHLVQADVIFTIPAGVLAPVTGLGLIWAYEWPFIPDFAWGGLVGWAIAGACWLPAWRLQYRMRDLAVAAAETGTPLPPAFHRASRWWMGLGFPSFAAAMITFWIMVAHHLPG
jgi:uncharacterized membrane protein